MEVDEGEDACLNELADENQEPTLLRRVVNLLSENLSEEENETEPSPDFSLGLDQMDMFDFDTWIVQTAVNDFNTSMLRFFGADLNSS